jgi:hypothetical protein
MNYTDRIEELIRHQRKYASFFEWFRKEKSIKEAGVVRSLIESMMKHNSPSYRNIRASNADPPDCYAETLDGALVGFEVRELVDQEAVELNERGKEVYRDWTTPEIVQELQKIIEEKDSKNYVGGPYEKLLLVIPTAEPVITDRQLRPVLESHEFHQTKQLHEAYLLFQYDPETQTSPYIQLRFATKKALQPTS